MNAGQRFWTVSALVCGCAAGSLSALADDGFYVGAAAVASLYDAIYDKTVDNTGATNASMLLAGQRVSARDSDDRVTTDLGVVAGYRGSVGVLFYSIEGDWTTHQGKLSSHLEGSGVTSGRNQVGENWPEDWSLAKDKSYGLTFRIGGRVPILNTRGYVLAGVRRIEADFRRSYTGCLMTSLCEPNEFETGVEFFDENFNAFSTGAGIEQQFDRVTVRAELRYVIHGSSAQLALFNDLGVRVPTSLEASEIGLGVSLLWAF